MSPRSERIAAVRAYFVDSAQTTLDAADVCARSIVAAAELIARVFRAGGKVLLCGNGGSAADCQHMATELVSRFRKDIDRPGLPAIALTTDSSFLTAFTNDCGFDGVFERQVQALGKPGDVVIGISTSGSSPNVIRALMAAHARDMRTIALTGAGGRLAAVADITVAVPSTDTQHIQETHLAIEHLLCHLVESQLFVEDAMSTMRMPR